MKLVAPKGAVSWICARAFNLCLLAIRFFFTIGLELIFLRVVVFYFWALLGKDHVHAIRNSAGLEGISDNFLGDLCSCRRDPTENKISTRHLLLASWGELKWPGYHPCQVLSAHIIFKGLVEALIQLRAAKPGLSLQGQLPRICFAGSLSPFTESVKWARNESHTRRERSPLGKLCLIHSLTPCSSIHVTFTPQQELRTAYRWRNTVMPFYQ